MEKLNSLLSQVKAAADTLKGGIAELDEQINAAHQRRAILTGETVTKADFLAYVEADIKAMGNMFAKKIQRHMAGKKTDFGSLETAHQAGRGMNIPYLTLDRSLPTVMTEEAVYLYFGDQILSGFAKAIDGMEWDDTMPADARRKELAKLDGKISSLKKERDELAQELINAGLAS